MKIEQGFFVSEVNFKLSTQLTSKSVLSSPEAQHGSPGHPLLALLVEDYYILPLF
jgi:hypothetical protein